jgi:hypothetical protein
MIRGLVRPTSALEAAQRALSQITVIPVPPLYAPSDAGDRPIAYRLEDYNGGKDPFAVHCADWSYGNRTPTADCVGLVLWASGIDRKQPNYEGSRGPWLNCASLIDDAHGNQVYCEPVDEEEAVPGDWLVTPDHIGMVVRRKTRESDILVVDCSPRHGRATSINTGYPWSAACQALRYKRYIP